MLTAVLYCAQPLNKTGYAPLTNIFLDYPFLSCLYKFSPVNKRLRNLGRIQFIPKSSSIHKNLFEPHTPDHWEKFTESLLYNFHREHILLKLKIKNYCKKLGLKTLQLDLVLSDHSLSKQIDLDQAWRIARPDLDPICLTFKWYS